MAVTPTLRSTPTSATVALEADFPLLSRTFSMALFTDSLPHFGALAFRQPRKEKTYVVCACAGVPQ
jgi:hypothetical protein